MKHAIIGILALLAPTTVQAVDLTESQHLYLECQTHTTMAFLFVSQCPQKFGAQPPVSMRQSPDCTEPNGLYVANSDPKQASEAGAAINEQIDAYNQAKYAELEWDGNSQSVNETVVANICEQVDVEQAAGSPTWDEIQRVTTWIER